MADVKRIISEAGLPIVESPNHNGYASIIFQDEILDWETWDVVDYIYNPRIIYNPLKFKGETELEIALAHEFGHYQNSLEYSSYDEYQRGAVWTDLWEEEIRAWERAAQLVGALPGFLEMALKCLETYQEKPEHCLAQAKKRILDKMLSPV